MSLFLEISFLDTCKTDMSKKITSFLDQQSTLNIFTAVIAKLISFLTLLFWIHFILYQDKNQKSFLYQLIFAFDHPESKLSKIFIWKKSVLTKNPSIYKECISHSCNIFFWPKNKRSVPELFASLLLNDLFQGLVNVKITENFKHT